MGALVAPGAALAEGPGYGGTADALTVQWQPPTGATGDGLAVYAVGFKGSSPVNLRVGSEPERPVFTDASGALRVLVLTSAVTPTPASTPDTTVLSAASAVSRLSTGASVLAVGETPTGVLRTLVGSVPPPDAGRGLQDVAPWVGAAAAVGALVVWTRRRTAALAGASAGGAHRYPRRHPARHRAA